MKKSGITRRCPECGRMLETNINAMKIEMWPQHNAARLTGQGPQHEKDVVAANRGRAQGMTDWEQPCFNSSTPV